MCELSSPLDTTAYGRHSGTRGKTAHSAGEKCGLVARIVVRDPRPRYLQCHRYVWSPPFLVWGKPGYSLVCKKAGASRCTLLTYSGHPTGRGASPTLQAIRAGVRVNVR